MSETKIFGDDSMDFKTSFDNDRVVAEAYDAISNAYGDACNEGSPLKSYLKAVNSAVGELQGSLDNISSSDIDDYKHFPVSTYNGHAVPDGFTPDPEDKNWAVRMLQNQLRDHLGTKSAEPMAGSGEPSEPEPDESDSDDNNQPEMEAVFDRIADDDSGVSGIGAKTAEKLRRWIAVNEVEISHEEIDVEVTISDKYDSLDEVPAEKVTQLSTEQIEELQS